MANFGCGQNRAGSSGQGRGQILKTRPRTPPPCGARGARPTAWAAAHAQAAAGKSAAPHPLLPQWRRLLPARPKASGSPPTAAPPGSAPPACRGS